MYNYISILFWIIPLFTNFLEQLILEDGFLALFHLFGDYY